MPYANIFDKNEQSREYYKKNREAILLKKAEYRKKVYQCPCGATVKLNGKSEHLQTMKHHTNYKSKMKALFIKN